MKNKTNMNRRKIIEKRTRYQLKWNMTKHNVLEEQDRQDGQVEHDGQVAHEDQLRQQQQNEQQIREQYYVQQLQLQQTNEQLQQLRLQFELLHRQHDDMTLHHRQAEMDIMELSDLIRYRYYIIFDQVVYRCKM